MNYKKSQQRFAIIILIAIFAISGIIACSSNSITGGNNSSSSSYSYWEEIPIPEQTGPVEPEDPDPTPPSTEVVLPITEYGAIQFLGKSFANETTTLTILGRQMPNQIYITNVYAVTPDSEIYYQFHGAIIENQKVVKGKFLVTANSRNGTALFTEDGYLKIWFNNDMSDLVTFKLTETTETPTLPDEEEPTPTPKPEDPKPTFGADTYVNIYAPWTKWVEGSGYIKRVSYEDTNTLTELWKAHIGNGHDRTTGHRWFIRDGDNHSQADPSDIVKYTNSLNYYYFDKNFDIVHAGKYAHRLKLKKFLGGVIVKYSRGNNDGTWTIGGLYQTLLNKATENSEGQKGYTKYENDNLNEFMRAIHNWKEGDLSVILMNLGYTDHYHSEFGVDEYYCTVDNNYRRNPEYFLGKNPTNYLGTKQFGYNHEKLNVRVNHSWRLGSGVFNYRFFSARPLNWHLE